MSILRQLHSRPPSFQGINNLCTPKNTLPSPSSDEASRTGIQTQKTQKGSALAKRDNKEQTRTAEVASAVQVGAFRAMVTSVCHPLARKALYGEAPNVVGVTRALPRTWALATIQTQGALEIYRRLPFEDQLSKLLAIGTVQSVVQQIIYNGLISASTGTPLTKPHKLSGRAGGMREWSCVAPAVILAKKIENKLYGDLLDGNDPKDDFKKKTASLLAGVLMATVTQPLHVITIVIDNMKAKGKEIKYDTIVAELRELPISKAAATLVWRMPPIVAVVFGLSKMMDPHFKRIEEEKLNGSATHLSKNYPFQPYKLEKTPFTQPQKDPCLVDDEADRLFSLA